MHKPSEKAMREAASYLGFCRSGQFSQSISHRHEVSASKIAIVDVRHFRTRDLIVFISLKANHLLYPALSMPVQDPHTQY